MIAVMIIMHKKKEKTLIMVSITSCRSHWDSPVGVTRCVFSAPTWSFHHCVRAVRGGNNAIEMLAYCTDKRRRHGRRRVRGKRNTERISRVTMGPVAGGLWRRLVATAMLSSNSVEGD